jgi:predicted esterase
MDRSCAARRRARLTGHGGHLVGPHWSWRVAAGWCLVPAMRPSTLLSLALAACGGTNVGDTSPDAAGADGPPGSGAPPVLPAPTGTCPTIAAGDVTFAPAGMPPRKVKLALDAGAATDHGELVLYWHATGSSPLEAAYSLGATQAAITAAGGIVAAPYADPSAGTFEWFIVNQSPKLDDFVLADEIVGCLAQAHRIDPTHIHSMGMSAGALQTTAVSFLRAAYIASVATYSGGVPPGFAAPDQDPANKFAALIFDGGAGDNVFGVDFKAASEQYKAMLTASGHFAELCDHGKGHAIPLDAAPSVAMFFAANGYGAWPSPYASGVPASFPAYCAR